MSSASDFTVNQETQSLPGETARAAYDRMTQDREPFLRRARAVARLTIPWVIPDLGTNGTTDLPTPFQSVGARGVNNLSSSLLLALFPPNAPFFKFKVDPYAIKRLSGNDQAVEEVKQSLLQAEEAVQGELEAMSFRPTAHEALRHLIMAGNALLYLPPDRMRVKLFHLDQYVIRRDPMGDPIRIITKEVVSRASLDADTVAKLDQLKPPQGPHEKEGDRTYDLYTNAELREGKWYVHQECEGYRIPGTNGTFATDAFPYIALRGNKADGESYGRSYGEEYLGDIQSLEGLTQAIVEGSAAAARVLFLVNPNGTTDVNTLSSKPNGAFAEGNANDVTPLRLDKIGDFQVASNTANAIETRLAFAFLLNSAVQRNAERVTAEEIRFMAEELEKSLGGMYSLLSQEFQLPLVNLVVARMVKGRRLPPIPKKIVKPTVVTGIEALGRGNDLNRLNAALGSLAKIVGPEALAQALVQSELMNRYLSAAGVVAAGLIVSPEEQAQRARQAQMQAAVQHLGPEVIKQVGETRRQNSAPPQGAQQGS